MMCFFTSVCKKNSICDHAARWLVGGTSVSVGAGRILRFEICGS